MLKSSTARVSFTEECFSLPFCNSRTNSNETVVPSGPAIIERTRAMFLLVTSCPSIVVSMSPTLMPPHIPAGLRGNISITRGGLLSVRRIPTPHITSSGCKI